MKGLFRISQKGQSLMTVAVFLVALIAMLALILDGGNAYLKRRQAQNAADAGALAGARELCFQIFSEDPLDLSVIVDVAEEYTETRNGATDSMITPDTNQKKVTVNAAFEFDTFFGNIFGMDKLTARATARAGCYSPTLGEGVLPTVWNCSPPVVGWDPDSTTCQQQYIDWDQLQIYLTPPDDIPPCKSTAYGQICPELYVIMDTESYNNDFKCVEIDPLGTLTCDLDGDGEPDWMAGGGRSWVDLDGKQAVDNCPPPTSSEGQAELDEWIENGYNCDIFAHTWLPEQTGAQASTFAETETRRQKDPIVVLPVFDAFCDGDPRTDPTCIWHPDGTDPSTDTIHADQPVYFHTIAFSAFYITCVRDAHKQECPGIMEARALNPIIDKESIMSIEGYFLTGFIPGLGGKGDPNFDTGIFTIWLDR